MFSGSVVEVLWKCSGSAVEVKWKCDGSAVEVQGECRVVQSMYENWIRPSPVFAVVGVLSLFLIGLNWCWWVLVGFVSFWSVLLCLSGSAVDVQ